MNQEQNNLKKSEKSEKSEKIENIVLSGGGIKGLAQLGALQALFSDSSINQKQIKRFVGSSVGGLICFFLSIGYNCEEIIEIYNSINWKKMQEFNWDDILDKWGICSFSPLIQNVLIWLNKRGIHSGITFLQHYKLFENMLVLTGTNLTMERLEYFNYESTPDMRIIDALRITMNYPLIYPPFKLNNCLYVDGAMMAPYPITFISDVNINETTIGLFLGTDIYTDDKQKLINNQTNGLLDYMKLIINCIYNRYCSQEYKEYRECTCQIDCSDVYSMDFDLDLKTKETLINIGKESMINSSPWCRLLLNKPEQDSP